MVNFGSEYSAMHIKIGTRNSKLALWQALFVQSELEKKGIQSSIVEILTRGDKVLDVSLSKIGSKGVFTEELEDMLHSGEIDIAVHSAKDVQSTLPDGLELIAFTDREEANDVLVGYKPVDLNDKANKITIGTSSTRRIALLKHYYPNLEIVDMRGNLQTRFEKLKNGHCDAMILAYAGVHRMDCDHLILQKLPLDKFIPPTGQGCIAIESAKALDFAKKKAIIGAINHPATEVCLRAERMYLKVMNGGCSIPTFAFAQWVDEKQISLRAGIVDPEGKAIISEVVTVPFQQAEQAGETIANKILQLGGKEILESIKRSK